MKTTRRLLMILFLVFVLLACSQPTTTEPINTPAIISTKEPISGIVKGFGISPQGFPTSFENLIEFFQEAATFENGGVFFNGGWRDDTNGGTDSGEIPEMAILVAREAKNYGYIPIVDFGWRSGETLHLNVPENDTNNWSNAEAKILFQDMLIAYCVEYAPPFLFLANENSFYYEQDPVDYLRFVDFYNTAYDSIKAVCPDTSVGVVFNYEHLAGTGKFSQWNTPQWVSLEAHDLDRIDVLGLTLYPWLGYGTVEEVPDDYLQELFNRIGNIPLAITETGWPGFYLDETILAWEVSNEAQVAYVDKLGIMLENQNIVMANWLFINPPITLADKNIWITFGNLSLYDLDNNPLPIYETWMNFSP